MDAFLGYNQIQMDKFIIKSIKWTTSSQEDEMLVHKVDEFIINKNKMDDFVRSIKWTTSSHENEKLVSP